MALFRPPNINEMIKKKDVRGLVKATGYKKDSGVRQEATEGLIGVWLPVVFTKSNTDEIFKWLEKMADSNDQYMLEAHEKIFRKLFPQFYSNEPKSRMQQEWEDRRRG